MSVRGTSHARLHRKVIIREGADEGGKIFCGWDDCDRDGLMLYGVRQNDARPGFPAQWVTFVFCSERHKQYWLQSYHRPGTHGRMPAGLRRMVG